MLLLLPWGDLLLRYADAVLTLLRPPPPPLLTAGAVNYTFSVAVPDSSNSVLSTLTSGVPPMQQHNNTLSLLFMQIGTVVVAVDPASGQQLWSHPTYNQTMPKITGYRCGGCRPGATPSQPPSRPSSRRHCMIA